MPQDAKQVAATAAAGFKLFQCEECADNVQQALIAAGYSGERIELRAGGGRAFIACLSYDNGQTSITLNGRHVGICVDGVVFDNLHAAGLERDDWLRDFEAPMGVDVFRIELF